MKIVIDIPEEVYSFIKSRGHIPYAVNIANEIVNGIPYEERPAGEWIKDSANNIICSNCGCAFGDKIVKLLYPFDFPYCPGCEADMRGARK